MEFCKVTLTFESVDKILLCDHSNESSLPVISHDAICFSQFWKMKFGRNLPLATFGSERVNSSEFNYLEARHHSGADGGFCDRGGLEI